MHWRYNEKSAVHSSFPFLPFSYRLLLHPIELPSDWFDGDEKWHFMRLLAFRFRLFFFFFFFSSPSPSDLSILMTFLKNNYSSRPLTLLFPFCRNESSHLSLTLRAECHKAENETTRNETRGNEYFLPGHGCLRSLCIEAMGQLCHLSLRLHQSTVSRKCSRPGKLIPLLFKVVTNPAAGLHFK